MEAQKAASLRNVRDELRRLLVTKYTKVEDIIPALHGINVTKDSIADLKIVCQCLSTFDRKYQGLFVDRCFLWSVTRCSGFLCVITTVLNRRLIYNLFRRWFDQLAQRSVDFECAEFGVCVFMSK